MTFPAARHRYTFRDYIQLEEMANTRHEYFDGEIYAMAGGSPEHALAAANVIASLNLQLRERDCRVYTTDLRIRVAATGLATYPDATVVCGPIERDPDDRNTAINPIVIVEVLSPSTEAYDRGDKLDHYKRIPSLREIVFVAHDHRALDAFRRERDVDPWIRERSEGPDVGLPSIGCVLSLDDLYRGVLPIRTA